MDNSLALLGTKPISADAAVGIAIRYEPEFEQLQTQIAKLEAMDGGAVNWTEVVSVGVEILEKKSKDLLVACYVCHGLYDKNGFSGLVDGLTILVGLVDTFWDDLFPELKRKRARVAALEWMVGRLSAVVIEDKPKLAERDAVANCRVLLEQLEELLKDKLGDQSIAWGELYRPVRDYDADLAREVINQQDTEQTKVEKAKGDQEKSNSAKTQIKDPTSATHEAVPQDVTSDQSVTKSLRNCTEILRKIAVYQREKNLADQLSYRFLRMATWLNLQLPVSRDNMTQVPQIPEERLTFLGSLVEGGDHARVINEVETSFFNAPFWLDAHRLTAMALQALGHKDAQQSVIAELAVILRRFPGLLECQFSSGVPFADDLTRQWIDDEVLDHAAANMAANLVDSSEVIEGSAPWVEVSLVAKQLVGKGKFREAINGFKDGCKQANSRRDCFLWDLHLARFCQGIGREEVAIPQLEFLDDQVERYHLEEWEPDLSVQIASLLLLCYKKVDVKGGLSADRAARKERMGSRVSRLDTATALELSKKTK